jgi:hypothetical protein
LEDTPPDTSPESPNAGRKRGATAPNNLASTAESPTKRRKITTTKSPPSRSNPPRAAKGTTPPGKKPAAPKKKGTQPKKTKPPRRRSGTLGSQLQKKKAASAVAAAAAAQQQEEEEEEEEEYVEEEEEEVEVLDSTDNEDWRTPHSSIMNSKPHVRSGQSVFWPAFSTKANHPKTQVWCNCCGTKLQVKSKGGTGSLISHLSFKHPEVYNLLKKPGKTEAKIITTAQGRTKGKVEQPEPNFKNKSGMKQPPQPQHQSSLSANKYRGTFITQEDRDDAKEKALVTQTLYLVCNGRPFSDSNNPEFKEMLEAAYDAGKKGAPFTFSPNLVRQKCMALACAIRDDLRSTICGKQVTATFDHWTSRAKDNFSCLTLHWIEDFELKFAVVAVYKFSGKAGTDEIVKDFLAKLDEFGVRETCKFCVTDTAPVMNAVGKELEKLGFEHIYCTDHSLQLTAVKSFNAGIFAEVEGARGGGEGEAAMVENEEGLSDSSSSSSEEEGVIPLDSDGNPIYPEGDDFNVEAEFPGEKKAKTLLAKARRIVAYFNKSTQALADLRKNYDHLWKTDPGPPKDKLADGWGLPQDVVTRWWSTYKMLDRLLSHHLPTAIGSYYLQNQGFKRTGSKQKIDNLTLEEWEALRELRFLLKPFKEAQQFLEGQKYITASLPPIVIANLQESLDLIESVPEVNDSVKKCGQQMAKDFQTRFGDVYETPFNPKVQRGKRGRQIGVHPALMVAHALDPRFKNLSLFNLDSIKEAIWDHILELLVERKYTWEVSEMRRAREREEDKKRQALAEEAQERATTTRPTQPPAAATAAGASDEGEEEEINPGLARLMAKMKESKASPSKVKSPQKAQIRVAMRMQLENYKRAEGLNVPLNKITKGCDDDPENNPLKWWKDNHNGFADVWKLAEAFLAIPATSAPSERAFSVASMILSIRRCRLKHNLLDDSVLLRENRHIVKRHVGVNLIEVIDSDDEI